MLELNAAIVELSAAIVKLNAAIVKLIYILRPRARRPTTRRPNVSNKLLKFSQAFKICSKDLAGPAKHLKNCLKRLSFWPEHLKNA